MKLRLRLFFPLLTLCACQPVQAEDVFDGTWINDRGSVVVLDQTGERLSGHYQTALGQPNKSATFPLTGWVQGDVISFTVNFKGYGSITAWNGQMSEDDNGDYIRTLWHLSRNVEDKDEDDDMWSSVIAGASEFRRVASARK